MRMQRRGAWRQWICDQTQVGDDVCERANVVSSATVIRDQRGADNTRERQCMATIRVRPVVTSRRHSKCRWWRRDSKARQLQPAATARPPPPFHWRSGEGEVRRMDLAYGWMNGGLVG